MRKNVFVKVAATSFIIFMNGVALSSDDSVAAGKNVYEEECADCHTISGKNKKGPSLVGMFGRKAGTSPGYENNSDAVKNSGITWNSDTLDQYIAAPKKTIPGTKMKYDGLTDSKARADLISFINSLKMN
jgi:cytochrome c